ncbi:hypothetical protein [Actinoplanes utahensis]|uniref:hypothetical protein n=1 Tax=Actinoplanes utahensis TaxID=1869 RepID=UPI000A8A9325|nr:hypothetical protein [Actinoplanes utahensis]GIF30321.1 hypothetical protein Aut01nite_33070 [Actinoplanes utahensis]
MLFLTPRTGPLTAALLERRVAYHVDTVSPPEKAAALEGCLDALDGCRARGLRP